jgi:hypothetical protein
MAKITLYKHGEFRCDEDTDKLVVEDRDIVRLGQEWHNDELSSVIVASGTWTLYNKADHDASGGSWEVSSEGGPNGDGLYPQASDWGGPNDVVSSVKRSD